MSDVAAAGFPIAVRLFWFVIAFILYTYLLYPLLAAAAARMSFRPVRRAPFTPRLTVVVAALNEAARLSGRINDLLAQHYPADALEIIVVSDGSTDATVEVLADIARRHPNVRPLLLPGHGGKAVALNAGVAAAAGELIVFADARQRFAPDAIARLAENFADPDIGSVSGELMLVPSGAAAVTGDLGLYWTYEKWIRRSESAFGSMLGATGAIYAIRRALWRPLPPGTLLDDFLVPMRIVLDRKRAIFDGRAIATDSTSTFAGQEFRRKLRTLAGNVQAFAFEPDLLIPWRNPATWFQVWSHKLFRLLIPWALLALLAASLLAAGSIYTFAVAAQAVFYGLALAGWRCEREGRPVQVRLVSFAYTFVTLNVAAACAPFMGWPGRSTASLWSRPGTG